MDSPHTVYSRALEKSTSIHIVTLSNTKERDLDVSKTFRGERDDPLLNGRLLACLQYLFQFFAILYSTEFLSMLIQ